MSTGLLLASVRVFCVFQFILVLLLVMIGGIVRSEMVYIIFSAVFGLLFDGFCHTIVRARTALVKQREMDDEFEKLIR